MLWKKNQQNQKKIHNDRIIFNILCYYKVKLRLCARVKEFIYEGIEI